MSLDLNGLLRACYDPTLRALRVVGFSDVDYMAAGDLSLRGATLSTTNDVDAVVFPDAATQGAGAQFLVNPAWQSIAIDLIWTNLGAGSGAVRWRTAVKDLADSNNTSEAFVSDTSANLTAPAQNVVEFSNDRITGLTVGADRLFSLTIQRIGADAGDTLTNNAGLLAVRLRRIE